MLGCLALNEIGIEITDVIPIQLFLDMAGTAIAAMALGPWRGAAVGYATAVITFLLGHGAASLAFGLVQITGALVWGYGVRRGAGRTLVRYLGLSVLAGAACTAVAAPVLVAVGGHTGHDSDTLYDSIRSTGESLVRSVVEGNLLTSLLDKGISSFIALVVLSVLPWAFRSRLPLAVALSSVSRHTTAPEQ